MQNRKKILILGVTGMLGSMVYKVLKNEFDLVITYKNSKKLNILYKKYGKVKGIKEIDFSADDCMKDYVGDKNVYLNQFFKKVGKVDAVINCLGAIKLSVKDYPKQAFFVNAILPHLLGNFYRDRFIHISTDCVFSGYAKRPYFETSLPDPIDLYGVSKLAGEPSETSLVLRMSFIGPELDGNQSLFNWFLSQKNHVQGYKDHFWNGLTTKEVAKMLSKIIKNREKFPSNGIYHIFSSDISKYELLNLLKKKYNLPIKIDCVNGGYVNRRMRTKFKFNKLLNIPSITDMVKNL